VPLHEDVNGYGYQNFCHSLDGEWPREWVVLNVMYDVHNSVELDFANCSVKWPLMRLTTDGSSSQNEIPAFNICAK